jgi:Protein of unknown function (DUF3800)
MHIFIDESGPFVVPKTDRWSVCCIAALVIPDSHYAEIAKKFEELRSLWSAEGKEVKGKDLDEQNISGVIQMLGRYDVLFEATAIDMGLQRNEAIGRHKEAQAQNITKNITPDHQPSLVQDLEAIQARLRQLSNPLYVQFALGAALLAKVIQDSTLYYVQRCPQELGDFRWVIDAKDKIVTDYENLWLEMICPSLMSKSFDKPHILLRGADYSAFQKYIGMTPSVPQYLRGVLKDEAPFEYTEIGKILGDVKFRNSDEELGIQLVDILCNALRRAMNGNLQRQGWETLGCLMVGAEKGQNVIRMVDLTATSSWVIKREQVPYSAVVELTDKIAKTMLYAGYSREHDHE